MGRSDTAGVDLEELKLSLTGMDRGDPGNSWDGPGAYDQEKRRHGHDWPATAVTMIGLNRLSHLQQCIEIVLADDVPGDLIETGVWRGGTCIFMRAVLKAHGVTDRTVWVADSFQGMPPDGPWRFPELAVPLDVVRQNFRDYDMLDDQVRFLPGWFADTLPGPVGQLAVLRMDGDYYSSTMDVLTHLYPKLSPGGYAIIDDWKLPARDAAMDYRYAHGIEDPVEPVDEDAACWRKS